MHARATGAYPCGYLPRIIFKYSNDVQNEFPANTTHAGTRECVVVVRVSRIAGRKFIQLNMKRKLYARERAGARAARVLHYNIQAVLDTNEHARTHI